MNGMTGWLLATALCTTAAAASAQTKAEDAASSFDFSRPSEFVRVLRKAGYPAELKKLKSGKPYVASEANGSDFSIYFYECDKLSLSCKSIEFFTWWKKEPFFTVELANKWNADKRFLKIAIDNDGDLEQRLYATTVGMNEANFLELLDWYESMDQSLAEFLKDAKPAEPKPKEK